MTFFSLCFVIFERLTPTFRLLSRLVLHFPSYLWAYPATFQSTDNDLQSPNFPLTEVAPPCTFRSSQKDCPSLYHPLVRLCFNKIVRRNIHFSVISHSLCNRTVMLFPVICISQGDIYQWLPILFIIAASIQFKSFYILIIVWIACVNVIDRFLCNQGVLCLL